MCDHCTIIVWDSYPDALFPRWAQAQVQLYAPVGRRGSQCDTGPYRQRRECNAAHACDSRTKPDRFLRVSRDHREFAVKAIGVDHAAEGSTHN